MLFYYRRRRRLLKDYTQAQGETFFLHMLKLIHFNVILSLSKCFLLSQKWNLMLKGFVAKSGKDKGEFFSVPDRRNFYCKCACKVFWWFSGFGRIWRCKFTQNVMKFLEHNYVGCLLGFLFFHLFSTYSRLWK